MIIIHTPQVESNPIAFKVQFDWSDCTDKSDPLGTIATISLAPDPLIIPGNASVSFAGSLRREIVTRTPVSTLISFFFLFKC